MSLDSRRALFSALQPLTPPTRTAPDLHENYADILEILAVASGLQSAHLHGETALGGTRRDEERLRMLEDIAADHGLLTLRTQSPRHHWPRPPEVDPEIAAWEEQVDLDRQRSSPEVLWIYLLSYTADAIPDIVAGRSTVGRVLGYPFCCVAHESELWVEAIESYARDITRARSPKSREELLDLYTRGVVVPGSDTSFDPQAVFRHMKVSRRRFAYIRFIACPGCVATSRTPAGVFNYQMRQEAFDVSPSFARRIWEARDAKLNDGQPIEHAAESECPCGSMRPFGSCCQAIP